MREMPWETRFQTEIQQAETARASGNEGKARVCARRAAGVVVGEFLSRQGITLKEDSAYAQLSFLAAQPDISPDLRDLIEHFLQRVTVEHNLPVEADLISEARQLALKLL